MQLHAAPTPDREGLQAAIPGCWFWPRDSKMSSKKSGIATTRHKPSRNLRPLCNSEEKMLDDPASWLQPGEGKLVFRGVCKGQTVAFVPLSSVLHQRYFVYHALQS